MVTYTYKSRRQPIFKNWSGHFSVFLICSWYILHIICVTGLVPRHQKKKTSNKEVKRPQQSLCSGPCPVAPQLQIQPQMAQSKPPFVAPPPVHVSASSLDSTQLLNSGFDPLAQFMNPHPTQPSTEPSPTITAGSAHVVSGLPNANTIANQMPTETHPFLNQHPIITSPGMYKCHHAFYSLFPRYQL